MNRIMNFLAIHWAGLILIGLALLFIFWTIGYFANGLYGLHFDLQSCWAGIACIAAAGVVGVAKYAIDSGPNSIKGQMPYQKDGDTNAK